MREFCLEATVVIVLLNHQFSLNFLQVFLQYLVVSVLFGEIVALHEDDIAHLIIHHSYQRINLIVIDLVV